MIKSAFFRSPQTQAVLDAVEQAAAEQQRASAIGDIGRLGLSALGVGAVARGLGGLMSANMKPMEKRYGPSTVTLPYPLPVKKKKQQKVAGEADGMSLGHLLGYRTDNTSREKSSTDKTSMPWYRPAMTLTGLAGLYGGWKTVDSVMDSQRRKAREKELDDAKQEFHNVLVGDTGMKTASESLVTRLGSLFDKIAQLVEHVKTAGPLSDMAGSAIGMYGTYAALSGLATGAIVYEQARKRQRRAILDKAMKKRQLQQYKMSPPEMIAVPEPVEVK